MNKEIWRDTKYEGYQVSNIGRVRSIDRLQTRSDGKTYHLKGKLMKLTASKGRGEDKPYLLVNLRQKELSGKGKSNLILVHRLVAETFIENPKNLPCVNHKDGNKQNNNVSNLEWSTFGDNNIHALKNELRQPRGNKIAQINPITKDVIAVFKSSCEASRETNISLGMISHCLNGRANLAGNFYWEKI